MRIWRAHPRLVVEVGAALLATAAALIGMASVAAAPRALLLFYDANSLLLELVHRSLVAGGPQHWTMSAALFFFPEIPVYEAVRAVSATPQQAIVINGLAYLLAVYVLLRVIAALLWPGFRGAAAALVAFLLLCLALVYETSASRDSLELVSDLLFGGYYNGTTLAMFGSVALAIVLVRGGSRAWAPASAVVLLAGLATSSNPLYVLWAAGPLGVALLLAAVVHRTQWRRFVLPGASVLAGVALGFLGRLGLERYISAPTDRYIHPGGVGEAAQFYAAQLRALSIGELQVVLVLCLCSVLGVVLIVRRELPAAATVVALFGALAMPLAFAINIGLGTQTPRYLQPMYFGQVLAVVVVVGWLPTSSKLRAIAARISPARRPPLAALGVALAGLLVVGGGVAAVNLATAQRTPPASIGCLEDWIDGRDLTGVGSFWNARPAQVYGDASVKLVQVDDDLLVDPWLVNLAGYTDLDVSYVVYGGRDQRAFKSSVDAQLGEPAVTVDCGDYWILDYVGSAAIADLGARLGDDARQLELERGFVS